MKNNSQYRFFRSTVLIPLFSFLAMALLCNCQAQTVKIDAINRQGMLSWTAPAGSDCSVEWASALAPAEWRKDWAGLQNMAVTNGLSQAAVPALYRITCWTNGLFIRAQVGQKFIFGCKNALGQAWEEHVHILGMAYIPAMTNNYMLVSLTHPYSGTPPAGITDDQLVMVRSTDEALLMLKGPGMEAPAWQKKPVGTTWTDGDVTAIIESIETVTVPTGTYTQCLKIKKTNPGNPNLPWFEYIKPGFFQVKWVDYQIEPASARPAIYELKQILNP